jgi:tetratricopeptide (TPR) repeat protein
LTTSLYTYIANAQIKATGSEPWAEALQRATSLSRHAKYRQAINSYQELLSRPPISSDVELNAYVQSQIADAQIELGEYGDAEERSRTALGNLASAGLAHTGTFAITEGVLADVLRVEGNYRDARSLANHAIGLATETMNPLQPRFAILLTTLGQVLLEAGDLSRARQVCQRAATIFEKAGEGSKIELGSAYQNLAVVYARQGRSKQALNALTLADTAWNDAVPANQEFEVYGLSTRIVVYQKVRAFREAEEIIPKVLKLGLSRFGADHPERVRLLSTCAGVYLAEKKYGQAESLLREAAEIARRQLPAGHPVLTNVLQNYSYVLTKLGRKDDGARTRAEGEILLAFPRNRDR